MSIPRLSLAVCTLVLFLGVNNFLRAQKSAKASQDVSLAARRLDNVKVSAQSIGQLFSDLSLSYDIPIGLEIASDDDESATYDIDFKKGALSELLTQFVARHDQYTWEIKDGVVNVFPKDDRRDLLFGALLETQISSFSVNQGTDCSTLAGSLVATPEIKQILENNGTTYRTRSFSGAYFPQLGRNFKLDVSNMTLDGAATEYAELNGRQTQSSSGALSPPRRSVTTVSTRTNALTIVTGNIAESFVASLRLHY